MPAPARRTPGTWAAPATFPQPSRSEIGLRIEDGDLYIYQVAYNPRMIEARAQRAGDKAWYVINPAFWPALNIKPVG